MIIEQFIENTTTNNIVEDISHIRNIGYNSGNYYITAEDGSSYVSLFEYNPVSNTVTRLAYVSSTISSVSKTNFITRVWGTDCASLIKYYDGTYYRLRGLYSDDLFATGAKYSINLLFDPTSNSQDINPVDTIHWSDGECYALYGFENTTTRRLFLKDFNTGTQYAGDGLADLDAIYGGYVENDVYYFLYTHDSGTLYYGEFDYASNTLTSTANSDHTVPATYSSNNQQYWKQSNHYFVMDQDHLYYKKEGESWRSKSDTGTVTNGIIWNYDTDGDYVINYVFWKDSIYKVYSSGILEKIQDFSDTVYTGWETWISNGETSIFEKDYLGTKDSTTFEIKQVQVDYNKGTMEFYDYTSTSIWKKNELVVAKTTWDGGEYDLFEGKVVDITYQDYRRKILLKAPWQEDLKQSKVTTTFIGKTANEILTSVLEDFTSYCSADIASSTTTYDLNFNNKSAEYILRTMCQAEGWIWYGYPDFTIYANDGTIDSNIDIQLDLVSTSQILDRIIGVDFKKDLQEVSIVELTGGYSDGERISAIYFKQDAVTSKYYRDNYPEITSTSKLLDIATNIGDNLNTEILQVTFRCHNKPPVYWGEQIDFQYTPLQVKDSSFLTSQKYYVNAAGYVDDSNMVQLSISDALILDNSPGKNRDGIDSINDQQLLDQTATNLEDHIVAASSIRFKQNIESYPGNNLMTLSPKSFEFKKDPGDRYLGLIAEEVPAEFQFLVAYDKKGLPKGINYHKLLIPLLKEVQIQKEEIQSLQDQITNLLKEKTD